MPGPNEFQQRLKRAHGIGSEIVTHVDSKKGVPPLKDVVASNRNTKDRYYRLLEGVGRGRSYLHLAEMLKLVSDTHAKQWLKALKAVGTERQNTHLDAFNGLGSANFEERRKQLANDITLFLHQKQELNEEHLASLEEMARNARIRG